MNIPAFDSGGTLPTFVGSEPHLRAKRSPYKCTFPDFVEHFNTSAKRATILLGLNSYRELLYRNDFVDGYQWLDGSFVEDIERVRKRAPADVDVVTLFRRPSTYYGRNSAWLADFRSKIHF